MSEMTNYRAMAKTLDVAAAMKFLGDRVPKLPRNAHGVAVTPDEWVLSGLYFVRATDPAASPQDVAAAKQWLSANGWDVPA